MTIAVLHHLEIFYTFFITSAQLLLNSLFLASKVQMSLAWCGCTCPRFINVNLALRGEVDSLSHRCSQMMRGKRRGYNRLILEWVILHCDCCWSCFLLLLFLNQIAIVYRDILLKSSLLASCDCTDIFRLLIALIIEEVTIWFSYWHDHGLLTLADADFILLFIEDDRALQRVVLCCNFSFLGVVTELDRLYLLWLGRPPLQYKTLAWYGTAQLFKHLVSCDNVDTFGLR